ncbi:family 1 glycosylhydrolase [Microbulbifer sp. YPW1]|uniref:family 1 glycosylhydrolase n=1 Tax=Microbulbifer sp. YPW1 TaxID=2745199 RepID=UPI0015991B14|nr:family 1 glycosylhydrolase [Microbulbifer sp. YPW1]QKX17196.1 family 1 glycosylhydrolase [Microbulbifer sp. YPW1]
MPSLPDFLWSVGEEGSDPWVSRGNSQYRMDQFTYSQHLEHQDQDLAAIAATGVRYVRYGMPWRLSERSPGVFDWTLWDQAFAACERAGLTPIIDLLHFGLPDYCDGFGNREWISHFKRYVSAFLRRYPEPQYFTPVNEPCFTALGSGYLGVWNDQQASEPDFLRQLAYLTLANLEALALIHEDREALWVSAETFNVQVGSTPELQAEAERRRLYGWLVWDLHLGINPAPEIAEALSQCVEPEVIARIRQLARKDHLLAGHDFYPNGVQLLDGSEDTLSIDERLALYEADARRWYNRYQVPFWISETSNFGLDVGDQSEWLEKFTATIARMRADGLPLNGFCWYSRGDQYDWGTLMQEPSGQVTEVGLYSDKREPRPVCARFTELVKAGTPVAATTSTASAEAALVD